MMQLILGVTLILLCGGSRELAYAQFPTAAVEQPGYGLETSPTWVPDASSIAKIENIDVQCSKNNIAVNITFSKPFHGIIFSKGYYSNPSCVHLQQQESSAGLTFASFSIEQNTCGLVSPQAGDNGQPNPSGTSIENTIVIQYDPRVQEVWDQARKIRCTWYDYYEKSVTFRPFQVNMLNAITANFLGDSLQCWMQIQVGKGPWAAEVAGIVKIGQTMTMVLGIKDEENKFDMMVRNCVAHDGKKLPIQLVDDQGCVTRKKIMSQFQKVQNFGPSASVVTYAYFQAFKFPDSVNVHFQCVIQVCRFSCPASYCDGQQQSPVVVDAGQQQYGGGAGGRRRREATEAQRMNVTASGLVQVLDPSDIKNARNVSSSDGGFPGASTEHEQLCISMPSYSGVAFTVLLVLLVSSLCHTLVTCKKLRKKRKA